MKISTKGRYALRIMLDIAVNGMEQPVRVKEIAARQNISEKYLEQIIAIMSKNGFVISSRGPMGGYRPAGQPKDYTAGSILRAVEGKLCPVACMETEENLCERKEGCMTLPLWEKLDDDINSVVDGITLQDLLDWHEQRTKV